MDIGIPFLLETETIEDCCRLARELGLAFVELNASFPECELERLNVDSLNRLAARYGLYFTLHVNEECNPFCFDEGVRLAWMNTLERSLKLAVRAGMPTVNMHMAQGVYITLPEKRVFLYEQCGELHRRHLEELRAMAERVLVGTGTRLCIENTSGFMPHELSALDFLLSSPVIGLTLDVGHDHAAGNRDLPYYEAHPSSLWHMHMHDTLGKDPHKALGDGETDLKARFALAARCGARVVLETKTVEALRTSVERLPRYL